MQIKRNTPTLLTTILPMALSLCFITLPAQACADVGMGLTILSLPVALPVVLFALFGLRRFKITRRLRLAAGGFLATIPMAFLSIGLAMDVGSRHQAGVLVQAIIVAVPLVIPTLYLYLSTQPKDSTVGRRWAMAKNAIGIFILFAVAMSGGVLLMLRV
jgi:hypothetical protein